MKKLFGHDVHPNWRDRADYTSSYCRKCGVLVMLRVDFDTVQVVCGLAYKCPGMLCDG